MESITVAIAGKWSRLISNNMLTKKISPKGKKQCEVCLQYYPESEITRCDTCLIRYEKIITMKGEIKDQEEPMEYCKNCSYKHEHYGYFA